MFTWPVRYRYWCKTFPCRLSSPAHARVHLTQTQKTGVRQDKDEKESAKPKEVNEEKVLASASGVQVLV